MDSWELCATFCYVGTWECKAWFYDKQKRWQLSSHSWKNTFSFALSLPRGLFIKIYSFFFFKICYVWLFKIGSFRWLQIKKHYWQPFFIEYPKDLTNPQPLPSLWDCRSRLYNLVHTQVTSERMIHRFQI